MKRLKELKPDENGMVRIISSNKCSSKFDMLIPFEKAVAHVKEGSAGVKDIHTVVKFKNSQQLKKLVHKRDKRKCHYCGKNNAETVDHKKPRSKGGYTTPVNLVSCCHECNRKKGSLGYEEFMRLIGR